MAVGGGSVFPISVGLRSLMSGNMLFTFYSFFLIYIYPKY